LSFSWKTSKASVRVNSEKLKSDYPEVYKEVSFEAKAARPFKVL
jgi:hypothetical protein